MGNRIICIGREFGSGGHEVAVRLSEKLGIKEGDGVWLVSPYCDHKVRAKVRVTILCQPGLIDAQYGWRGDQETQPLIPRKNWDPISGYPCCNDVCIRVEKA